MSFDDKLSRLVERHHELADAMAREGPRSAQDHARLSKEYAELLPMVETIVALQKARGEMVDLASLMKDSADDPDLARLAEGEYLTLKEAVPRLEHQIKLMLLPKDEADERNAILEVRAGTGGE